jgi:hypothetical protein
MGRRQSGATKDGICLERRGDMRQIGRVGRPIGVLHRRHGHRKQKMMNERTNERSNDDKLSNKPRTKQKSRCTHLGTSEGDYGGEQQGGEYELHDDGVDGRNAATTERQWLAMIWVAVIVF